MTVIRVNYSNGSAYLWTPFGSYFYRRRDGRARRRERATASSDIIVAAGAGIPGMVRIWDGKTHDAHRRPTRRSAVSRAG